MDRGAWRAMVSGVAKSQTRLSDDTAGAVCSHRDVSTSWARGHPDIACQLPRGPEKQVR